MSDDPGNFAAQVVKLSIMDAGYGEKLWVTAEATLLQCCCHCASKEVKLQNYRYCVGVDCFFFLYVFPSNLASESFLFFSLDVTLDLPLDVLGDAFIRYGILSKWK